jgi:hypothetical protein
MRTFNHEWASSSTMRRNWTTWFIKIYIFCLHVFLSIYYWMRDLFLGRVLTLFAKKKVWDKRYFTVFVGISLAVVVGSTKHTKKSHEMTSVFFLLCEIFLWLFALSSAELRSSLILFRFNLFLLSLKNFLLTFLEVSRYYKMLRWNFSLLSFWADFAEKFIMHKQFSPHYGATSLLIIIFLLFSSRKNFSCLLFHKFFFHRRNINCYNEHNLSLFNSQKLIIGSF